MNRLSDAILDEDTQACWVGFRADGFPIQFGKCWAMTLQSFASDLSPNVVRVERHTGDSLIALLDMHKGPTP